MQREGGPEPINAVFVSGAGSNGSGEEMPEPLRYNILLTNLFKFSYFVKVTDGTRLCAYMRASECGWTRTYSISN